MEVVIEAGLVKVRPALSRSQKEPRLLEVMAEDDWYVTVEVTTCEHHLWVVWQVDTIDDGSHETPGPSCGDGPAVEGAQTRDVFAAGVE